VYEDITINKGDYYASPVRSSFFTCSQSQISDFISTGTESKNSVMSFFLYWGDDDFLTPLSYQHLFSFLDIFFYATQQASLLFPERQYSVPLKALLPIYLALPQLYKQPPNIEEIGSYIVLSTTSISPFLTEQ
jgi:hypothetical protein